MLEIITVYITIPSLEKAQEIARVLLEKHLIACATMWPCQSMYRWEGALQCDQEHILFLKTTEQAFAAVQQEVTAIHPYRVPCMLKMAVEANEPYAQWVHKEVNL